MNKNVSICINTSPSSEQRIQNLMGHVKKLMEAAGKNERSLADQEIVPPDTVITIYEKQVKIGATVKWLENIIKALHSDIANKQATNGKLIVTP